MKLLHGAEREMKENQLTEGGLTGRQEGNNNCSRGPGASPQGREMLLFLKSKQENWLQSHFFYLFLFFFKLPMRNSLAPF